MHFNIRKTLISPEICNQTELHVHVCIRMDIFGAVIEKNI